MPIFLTGKKKPVSIVRQYIAALNARDPDTIGALLAENCRFVDGTGGWVEGRDNAMAGTRAFLDLETDFRITEEDIVVRGDAVPVRGTTSAQNPQLAKGKLWRAKVEDGKLAFWQSYGAESLPLARILLPEAARISDDANGTLSADQA